MYLSQQSYRDLYEVILEHDGPDCFPRIITPWLDRQADSERPWLARWSRPGPIDDEDSCRLYSLSRVLDLLLLGFQPGDGYAGVDCSAGELEGFARTLGIDCLTPQIFHPFFCEIVEVEPDPDPMAPTSLLQLLWPALLVGDLMLARAGCRVRAGAACLDPESAAQSPLYWSFRRRHRPTRDLSQGWGSNSQWRTAFRRDYREPDGYRYNLDGQPAQSVPDWGRELLIQRCALRPLPHDDPWPWDWTTTELLSPS